LGHSKQKQRGLRGLLCRWPSITEWEMYITAQGCRLRNDLYCVEPDVKLYYTIPYLHLAPAHHSHPPSHTHSFIPGLKLTFSTNLFHHAPMHLDCLLGLYWTGLILLYGFNFYLPVFFFPFILRRAVDYAGLVASFHAHVNKESSGHITSHIK